MAKATKFEFEQRFWILVAIYVIAFWLGNFDRVSMIAQLWRWVGPSIPGQSHESAHFARIVITIGAVLVFVTAALRTWGGAYLRSEIVHDTKQHSDTLVAEGPFRFTRNPLYLGNLPMAAGIGLLASRAGFIFLVIANWIFVYRLIFREEEALRKSQGEPYLAYCRSVPRFWPSLRPRVPASGLQPHWVQAFGGEIFVWFFGFAELAVAATLSARVGWVLFIAGIMAAFIMNRGMQRRRAALARALRE